MISMFCLRVANPLWVVSCIESPKTCGQEWPLWVLGYIFAFYPLYPPFSLLTSSPPFSTVSALSMPRIESAIKRARQNIVRNERLQPYKTRMKTMMRKVRDAANEEKKVDMAPLVKEAYKAIDIAAKKNIIHKNNAARKKSSIARIAAGGAK